ncbi:MutS-related protein [Clostridium kluyveri]|uniref:MutS-related protein n=1 Tax=Clostridium kluyveri TaxID=1534 RepID=UPI0022480921|nr:DNA mismatch repair protein MutS [Clostridium kluyveri]UZQ48769.1 DNA mismatch repair protein MutS [Clostridium kluyveri]
MAAVIGYIVMILIVSILISAGSNIKNNSEIKRRIILQWGKEPEKKYNEEDITNISKYFINRTQNEMKKFFIDQITWHDLDMDEIFKDLNSTESTPGEECLYTILREPLYNQEELKYRDETINFFKEHEYERKAIQYLLAKLGKRRGLSITDYFYNDSEKTKSSLIFYRILGIMPLVSVILFFVNIYLAGVWLIIFFGINTAVHYIEKGRIDYKLRDFMYMIKIVRFANLILKQNINKLAHYNRKLKDSLNSIRSIKNISFNLSSNGTDISLMLEYVNILFLRDLINYEKMCIALEKKSHEFKVIFQVVGILDSCIAIASYRERLKFYVVPELYKCSKKREQNIEIKDIVHPLIKSGIGNSINISDSILITGSNASGKSTFLKTIAINMIFAQTICTCTARYFKCCYLNLHTSMALKDSIFNNESYYIAETKSLKRIIDSLNEQIPTICFVDEILRGTNTVERIAASSQVLKYLTINNCICIAATHDVELTYILERYFENYHFQEKIVNDKILFDYKIHNGRATTQNAIKLLGILGYNHNIVKKAQEKALKFVQQGIWKAE